MQCFYIPAGIKEGNESTSDFPPRPTRAWQSNRWDPAPKHHAHLLLRKFRPSRGFPPARRFHNVNRRGAHAALTHGAATAAPSRPQPGAVPPDPPPFVPAEPPRPRDGGAPVRSQRGTAAEDGRESCGAERAVHRGTEGRPSAAAASNRAVRLPGHRSDTRRFIPLQGTRSLPEELG